MGNRESFGSKFAVLAALAGSAIGLGNIWRFPYMVGENGGAAFIIIYRAASLLLSVPIFLAEFTIGRRSGANCFGALKVLSPGTGWKWLGVLCILTPTLILSYYAVVGGWSLHYLFKACTLGFLNSGQDGVAGSFGIFISSPYASVTAFAIYMAVSCLIVVGGVRKGIEAFSKFAIPVLFVLIIALAIYSLTIKGGAAGVEYLLKPDFSKVTASTFANAIGQSFYSISLGMGIIITYSSYVSKDENMLFSGIGTAGFDLLFALLAGFVIMPAVFAAGIAPGAGPGLIFDTLPYIFASMCKSAPVVGCTVAIFFFLSVVIAALTSSVSLIEVPVAWLIEERKLGRGAATAIVFIVTGAIGAVCALAFGPLKGCTILGHNLFDALDLFCCNFLLPVGGMLCVIFVGWKMKRSDFYDEFTNGGKLSGNAKLFPAVYFLLRYLAPVAVAIIFASNFL